MDRSIYYSGEQLRSFDLGWFERDALAAVGNLQLMLAGTSTTVLGGLAATATSPTSLAINIGAGSVAQQFPMDSTSFGSLSSDASIVQQIGSVAGQQVQLSTAALSSGQSQWALIEAQFAQVDVIRAGDPTGGLLYYYNSANPTQPFQGPNNSGQTQTTEREATASVRVVYGSPATTGSEVPPNVDTGWVPMYLIDLTFGQAAISQGQILVAGPSVGANVPSNYPGAPFVAGLLNSHHGGTPGQAPQIDLTSEVKNTLPLRNSPASNTTGGLPVMHLYAGNPNGNVAGNASVNGASDFAYDTLDKVLFICTQTGNAAAAIWTAIVGSTSSQFAGGTTSGTANAQVIAATTPGGFSLTPGYVVTATVGAGLTNTGATTLNVDSTGAIAINKNTGSGNVPLSGGELQPGAFVQWIYTGSVWLLQAQTLGQLATLNIGQWLKNDGSGNLTIKNGLALADDGAGNLTVAAGGIQPSMIGAGGAPLPFIGVQPNDNLNLVSDPTNPTFVVDVAAGRVRDDSDLTNIQMIAAMTKRLDESWVAGTGNGGCDSSTKGPNQTWHGYVIGKTGMAITNYARASNIASLTIPGHNLGIGSTLRVGGLGLGFDAVAVLTSVTTNTVNYANAGSNISIVAAPATALADGFDVLFSQFYPSPTMPSGYNVKQCLGSVLTDGSSNLRSFKQYADEFWLINPVNDLVNSNLTAATPTLETFSVPAGVKVQAIINVQMAVPGGGPSVTLNFSPPDIVSAPPLWSIMYIGAVGTPTIGNQIRCWTNTSQQIRAVSTQTGNLSAATYGWRDPRRRMF